VLGLRENIRRHLTTWGKNDGFLGHDALHTSPAPAE
jgi:hypothetical protein